jgi:hypothetical protein
MTEADFDDGERFKPWGAGEVKHSEGSWAVEIFQQLDRDGDWFQLDRERRLWRNVGKQAMAKDAIPWEPLQ